MTRHISQEWRLPVYALSSTVLVFLLTTGIGRLNEARHLMGLDAERVENVAVALAFEPERFHIEAFQEVGRYQGWSNGRAVIMAVDPSELRKLARNYWVGTITPLEATQ